MVAYTRLHSFYMLEKRGEERREEGREGRGREGRGEKRASCPSYQVANLALGSSIVLVSTIISIKVLICRVGSESKGLGGIGRSRQVKRGAVCFLFFFLCFHHLSLMFFACKPHYSHDYSLIMGNIT